MTQYRQLTWPLPRKFLGSVIVFRYILIAYSLYYVWVSVLRRKKTKHIYLSIAAYHWLKRSKTLHMYLSRMPPHVPINSIKQDYHIFQENFNSQWCKLNLLCQDYFLELSFLFFIIYKNQTNWYKKKNQILWITFNYILHFLNFSYLSHQTLIVSLWPHVNLLLQPHLY